MARSGPRQGFAALLVLVLALQCDAFQPGAPALRIARPQTYQSPSSWNNRVPVLAAEEGAAADSAVPKPEAPAPPPKPVVLEKSEGLTMTAAAEKALSAEAAEALRSSA